MKKVSQDTALMRLIIRKTHTLCTHCLVPEPIYVSDSMPARAFIEALQRMAQRHQSCDPNDPQTIKERRVAMDECMALHPAKL